MSDAEEFIPLDASNLDLFLGQPLPVYQLREPVAVDDIRCWVQSIHYPNPLHFDPDYAADSCWHRIVAPQIFVASTEIAHGIWPNNIGHIANSALLFGATNGGSLVGRSIPLGQGVDLPATVMPFILRNVALLGVDSVKAPIAKRKRAWERLATDLDPAMLDGITRTIPFEGTEQAAHAIIDGKVHGRIVVEITA